MNLLLRVKIIDLIIQWAIVLAFFVPPLFKSESSIHLYDKQDTLTYFLLIGIYQLFSFLINIFYWIRHSSIFRLRIIYAALALFIIATIYCLNLKYDYEQRALFFGILHFTALFYFAMSLRETYLLFQLKKVANP